MIKEVENALASFENFNNLKVSKFIGVKEILLFKKNKISYNDMTLLIYKSNKKYAKKQLT